MNDLTLLYYTPNTNPEYFSESVRAHLLQVTEGKIPIISVSQKPIDFGKNICVGEIGRSFYNLYKQIYIGAQNAKTPYVALCEDDTLYNIEHFSHRPSSDDVFSYNLSMWNVQPKGFWHITKFHEQYNSLCICSKKLLIYVLGARFDTFPSEPNERSQKLWLEPGKHDTKFGIPNAKIEFFKTRKPVLTFNFRGSIGGKRITSLPRTDKPSIPVWGNAMDLCTKFYGTKYV